MQMRFNLWVGNADFGGNFTPGILPVHQFINWVSFARYAPGAGEDGGDFAPTWREDFDGPLDANWSLGTWGSPFNLSVHSPANLTIVNGKAVLSLTADNALGFPGQPTADPADVAGPPGVMDPVDDDEGPPTGQGPDAGAPTDVGGTGMEPSAGGPAESPSLPTPDLSGDEASPGGNPPLVPGSSGPGQPAESGGGDSAAPLDGLPALTDLGPAPRGSDGGCALARTPPGPSGATALGCIAWLVWRRRRRNGRNA
jgi:hypothetical protein